MKNVKSSKSTFHPSSPMRTILCRIIMCNTEYNVLNWWGILNAMQPPFLKPRRVIKKKKKKNAVMHFAIKRLIVV